MDGENGRVQSINDKSSDNFIIHVKQKTEFGGNIVRFIDLKIVRINMAM